MKGSSQLPAVSDAKVLQLAEQAKVLDDPFYQDRIYGACHSKNPALRKFSHQGA